MKKIKDLTGKTMVVTGATAGIGKAALRALAARGAYVIAVGRSAARCQETLNAILAETPDANIDFVLADLATQRAVRDLADDIQAHATTSGGGKIDALINNAGTVSSWYVATEDGYELQFAVNHLAPFLLTHELLPLLEKSESGRIVTVSSGSHRGTRMHWKDVMFRKGYSILQAYKQSKLANVLFSAELNRRLADRSAVRAYAADPGLVTTEIGLKGTSGIENWVWQKRMENGVSPEEGAETVVFLATDPWVAGSSEVYWKDCQPTPPSRYARRLAEATRLWSLSESLCGLTWA